MTGHNHHRVGTGQITEFADDGDGDTGVIPKSPSFIRPLDDDQLNNCVALTGCDVVNATQIANGQRCPMATADPS